MTTEEGKKPLLWRRFNWARIEKDGEVTIGPYEEFPSHVQCPKCGKNTDYNIWQEGGCIYCRHSEPVTYEPPKEEIE